MYIIVFYIGVNPMRDIFFAFDNLTDPIQHLSYTTVLIILYYNCLYCYCKSVHAVFRVWILWNDFFHGLAYMPFIRCFKASFICLLSIGSGLS